MKTEEKNTVNYLHFLNDRVRISHETSYLTADYELPTQAETQKEKEKVREEIRKRKKVVAGLHHEIRILEDLL